MCLQSSTTDNNNGLTFSTVWAITVINGTPSANSRWDNDTIVTAKTGENKMSRINSRDLESLTALLNCKTWR